MQWRCRRFLFGQLFHYFDLANLTSAQSRTQVLSWSRVDLACLVASAACLASSFDTLVAILGSTSTPWTGTSSNPIRLAPNLLKR
jgi:hypothetical protein